MVFLTPMPSKTEIINAFKDKLNTSLQGIQDAINQTEQALQEETKSSAGDKYETSREMLQADLDRLESQRSILQSSLALFADSTTNDRINAGSIAEISIDQQPHTLYIGPAIGNVTVDTLEIRAISTASPLGAALLGKLPQEEFSWNGKSIRILNCY